VSRPSLISVDQLTVHHRGARRPAVREVCLSVARGQVLGVVGASGAGKTSLLRAWLGLIAPTSGVVRWGHDDLSSLSARARNERRRLIQPVFQNPAAALDPRMTIAQCLAEPFKIHGFPVSGSTLERILADVQLSAEVLPQLPRTLSAGQRQRVAIARALALEPEVLLLDEPVSALDVSVQAQVVELLRQLRDRRGLTMVLVSHDLDVVRALSTDVAVMFAGRVIERGSLSAVTTTPLHPYFRSLLGSDVVPAVDRPIADEPGCAFRKRCPFATAACDATPSMPQAAHAAACVMVR
jgi:ABC-type glutathione transport system ATPase component